MTAADRPKCTWENCENVAYFSQRGKDGKQWAHLCKEHHNRLHKTFKSGEPKAICAAWVKAQGGAHLALRRMNL